jgi:tripartite-type tricarboxylate transporter receptor subunit TctC
MHELDRLALQPLALTGAELDRAVADELARYRQLAQSFGLPVPPG